MQRLPMIQRTMALMQQGGPMMPPSSMVPGLPPTTIPSSGAGIGMGVPPPSTQPGAVFSQQQPTPPVDPFPIVTSQSIQPTVPHPSASARPLLQGNPHAHMLPPQSMPNYEYNQMGTSGLAPPIRPPTAPAPVTTAPAKTSFTRLTEKLSPMYPHYTR